MNKIAALRWDDDGGDNDGEDEDGEDDDDDGGKDGEEDGGDDGEVDNRRWTRLRLSGLTTICFWCQNLNSNDDSFWPKSTAA